MDAPVGIPTAPKPFIVKAIKAFDKGARVPASLASDFLPWSVCAIAKVEMRDLSPVFVANFFKHLEKLFSLPSAIVKK